MSWVGVGVGLVLACAKGEVEAQGWLSKVLLRETAGHPGNLLTCGLAVVFFFLSRGAGSSRQPQPPPSRWGLLLGLCLGQLGSPCVTVCSRGGGLFEEKSFSVVN